MCGFHNELQHTIFCTTVVPAFITFLGSARATQRFVSVQSNLILCVRAFGGNFLFCNRYAVLCAVSFSVADLCWCILFFFIEYSGAWLLFFASMEIGILCCCFYDFLTTFYNAIYLMLFSSVFLRKLLFSYHLWIWFFLASQLFFCIFF